MTQTLIIGSRDSGTKNNPQVIFDSLTAKGVDARLAYWEDLVFDISTGNVQVSIGDEVLDPAEIDLVLAVGWYKTGPRSIYRDIAYSFALFLESHAVPFWNSEMLQQRSVSKLSTMVQLALKGIAVPKTIASLTSEYATRRMSLPYVAKAAAASRGQSNYLVTTEAEQEKVLQNRGSLFLLQEYLENDHDLRVICFGGEPTLVLRRSRDLDAETHLNNVSQGGAAEWLEISGLSDELLTFCRNISKIMNRELAGIDLIPDANSAIGYSCLEVNAVPQLTTGTDTTKKLDALATVLRSRKED